MRERERERESVTFCKPSTPQYNCYQVRYTTQGLVLLELKVPSTMRRREEDK